MFRIAIIFLFISFLCSGQEKSYPEIDTAFYRNFKKAHHTGKFGDAITFAKKLTDQSRKLNYQKGVSKGYISTANFLSSMGGNKESIHYLQLAEKHSQKVKDNLLKSELYAEYAMVYDKLGMSEIAIAYYNKAIEIDKKIATDYYRKGRLVFNYSNKADIYQSLRKYDSAYFNYQKAYKLVSDPISASGLALYFIDFDGGKVDSAKYYLKVATDSINLHQYDPLQKIVTQETWGDFYFYNKNYHKSIEFYNLALDIALRIKNHDEIISNYKGLSEAFQALNNGKKASEYILKYTKLGDSISVADKDALNLSVNKLMRDKEGERRKVESNALYLFSAIFFCIIIMVIFGYLFYRRKRKEKESIIGRQDIEITQTKSEKKILEHKVNDAFQEVLELAKKNDPSFLARFKEVYPDFCEKFLVRYPNIVASEFIFCAYLKLNFSTKEIAHYTFVTDRAVQVRKSRLRKKLNIPSEEDLYIWINKI